MRRIRFRFAISLLLAVAASTVGPGRAASQPATALLATTAWNDPRCPGERWLGIVPVNAAAARICPSATNFEGRPLFAGLFGGVSDETLAQARRAGLDRVCLYEPAGGPAPPPAELESALEGIAKDCVALQSAATPGSGGGARWREVERRFLAKVGALELALGGRARVRLSLLDTQPTGRGVPLARGVSAHGFSLAHLAHRLGCGPGEAQGCALELATRLAMPVREMAAGPEGLPRVVLGEPLHEGGRTGRLSDLAAALVEEAMPLTASDGIAHRVAILALGWEGAVFGGLERRLEDVPAPARAVLSALAFARAQGLLVVAAAGNRSPISSCGPLLPAAWEHGVPESAPEPAARLVYGAGSVQLGGLPLANALPCSLPRRVAFGDHGFVVTRGSGTTRPLTGSSVAAAVIATAAAMVWAHRPELGGDEVIALVEAAGTPLPGAARFTAPQVGSSPVEVAVCAAVRAACGGTCGMLRCPSVEAPDRRGRPAIGRPSRGDTATHCATDTCRAPRALPAEPRAPVWPQPEEDPCLNCTAGGRRQLRTGSPVVAAAAADSAAGCRLSIEIDPEWFARHATVDRLDLDSLEMRSPVTGESERLPIAGGSFTRTSPGPFELSLGADCPDPGATMYQLVFRPTGRRTTEVFGQLLVMP